MAAYKYLMEKDKGKYNKVRFSCIGGRTLLDVLFYTGGQRYGILFQKNKQSS